MLSRDKAIEMYSADKVENYKIEMKEVGYTTILGKDTEELLYKYRLANIENFISKHDINQDLYMTQLINLWTAFCIEMNKEDYMYQAYTLSIIIKMIKNNGYSDDTSEKFIKDRNKFMQYGYVHRQWGNKNGSAMG